MYEFIVIDVEEDILAEAPLKLTLEAATSREAYVKRFFKFPVKVIIRKVS